MGTRIINTSIVCAFIAFIIVLGVVVIPNSIYNYAITLMYAEKYEQAIDVWNKISGYKDAYDQIMKCCQYLGYHKKVIDYYEYTEYTIPDGVTSIDDEAFSECTGLTSIIIPDSVTRIAAGAFAYCEKLTSIKYRGTEAEWEAISKGTDIFQDAGSSTITYEYKGD